MTKSGSLPNAAILSATSVLGSGNVGRAVITLAEFSRVVPGCWTTGVGSGILAFPNHASDLVQNRLQSWPTCISMTGRKAALADLPKICHMIDCMANSGRLAHTLPLYALDPSQNNVLLFSYSRRGPNRGGTGRVRVRRPFVYPHIPIHKLFRFVPQWFSGSALSQRGRPIPPESAVPQRGGFVQIAARTELHEF